MKAIYPAPTVSTESQLADVGDDITERLNRGEQVEIAEYAGRFPLIAEKLTRVFETLCLIRWLAERAAEA